MQNQLLIHTEQIQEIPEYINPKDIIPMPHLLEIRVLDARHKEHKMLLNFDGHAGLFPGWGAINIMEELNVHIKEPLHKWIPDNMIGLKSTGYRLSNGIYRKTIDWIPQVFKPY